MKSSGQNKYKSITSYIILGLALVSIAFLGVVNPIRNQPSLGAIAAKVDGIDIKREDFLRRYQRILNYYKQFQGSEFDPGTLGLAKNVLNSMIDELAWYQKAKDNGALASIEEISARIVEQPSFYDKDGHFSRKLMQQVLRQNGLTETALAEDIRFQLSSSKLRQHIFNQSFVPSQVAKLNHLLKESKMTLSYLKIEADKIPVTVSSSQVETFLEGKTADKEVSFFYNRNKRDYQAPEEFKLSQILVSYKGAERAVAVSRSKEEALKHAQKLLGDLKKSPKTFASVAKKESDDLSSKSRGGDLGFLEVKEMPKALADKAPELKKGTLSEVLESPLGFHIVRLEDKKEKKDISLEDAKNSIAKKLIEEKERFKLSNEVAKEILAALKVGQSGDILLKKYKLKWEKTEESALNARTFPSQPEEFMDAALGLKKEGDLHPHVINKYKVNYIVKLDSRSLESGEDLPEEDLLVLRENMEAQQERDLLYRFEKLISEEVRDESKHTLYVNPQYEALDNPRT